MTLEFVGLKSSPMRTSLGVKMLAHTESRSLGIDQVIPLRSVASGRLSKKGPLPFLSPSLMMWILILTAPNGKSFLLLSLRRAILATVGAARLRFRRCKCAPFALRAGQRPGEGGKIMAVFIGRLSWAEMIVIPFNLGAGAGARDVSRCFFFFYMVPAQAVP